MRTRTMRKMSARMRNLCGFAKGWSGGANLVKEFKTFVRRPVTGAQMERTRMKVQHARTHQHKDIVQKTNGDVASAKAFNNSAQRRVTAADVS